MEHIASKVGTPRIKAGAVTPAKVKTKAEVALSDGNATLTASQLVDSGIFTITPTENRTLTTDTAANIIAALPDYLVGTYFDFTIVNLAAATYTATLAAGTGVTITGSATVAAASSGTFRAVVTSANAVTVYRK
jgi:hypothetical protein